MVWFSLFYGVLTLVLTAPRGGIPLWSRLLYRLRGSMLLLADIFPEGVFGYAVRWLDLPTDLMRLDGAQVFAPPDGEVAIDLSEWITFAHAREQDGLVFVDTPLVALQTEEG